MAVGPPPPAPHRGASEAVRAGEWGAEGRRLVGQPAPAVAALPNAVPLRRWQPPPLGLPFAPAEAEVAAGGPE